MGISKMSQCWRKMLAACICCVLIFPRVTQQGPSERRLLDHLFVERKHNKLERPVANESEALTVKFGVVLQQIISVVRSAVILADLSVRLKLAGFPGEEGIVLTHNLFVGHSLKLKFLKDFIAPYVPALILMIFWKDYSLWWNESQFGGIKNIRVPASIIWKPDVLMYNSADEDIDSTFHTNVVLSSDGGCLWVPPGLFLSTCKIDITWFPFDEQLCKLKFGSWSYDSSGIDLQLQQDSGDRSNYIPNGEWILLAMPAVRNVVKYDCCPELYIDVTFTVRIQRRTLYYGFNLIIPCVLISSMALLTFTLPPDAGEKISLGVTILLSLTVFLLLVAETMPPTSDAVPLIGMYFASIMLMCSLSVVFTVLVLNFHHRTPDNHKMPRWIKTGICEWLAWILRIEKPCTGPDSEDRSQKAKNRKPSRETSLRKRSNTQSNLCPEFDQDNVSSHLLTNPMNSDSVSSFRGARIVSDKRKNLSEILFEKVAAKEDDADDEHVIANKAAAYEELSFGKVTEEFGNFARDCSSHKALEISSKSRNRRDSDHQRRSSTNCEGSSREEQWALTDNHLKHDDSSQIKQEIKTALSRIEPKHPRASLHYGNTSECLPASNQIAGDPQTNCELKDLSIKNTSLQNGMSAEDDGGMVKIKSVAYINYLESAETTLITDIYQSSMSRPDTDLTEKNDKPNCILPPRVAECRRIGFLQGAHKMKDKPKHGTCCLYSEEIENHDNETFVHKSQFPVSSYNPDYFLCESLAESQCPPVQRQFMFNVTEADKSLTSNLDKSREAGNNYYIAKSEPTFFDAALNDPLFCNVTNSYPPYANPSQSNDGRRRHYDVTSVHPVASAEKFLRNHSGSKRQKRAEETRDSSSDAQCFVKTRTTSGDAGKRAYGKPNSADLENKNSSGEGVVLLEGILEQLRTLTDKMKADDRRMDECNEWKFAAIVIDRLCLILFTLFTFVSTVAILFSAPHVFV